jgi:hypothetical protein
MCIWLLVLAVNERIQNGVVLARAVKFLLAQSTVRLFSTKLVAKCGFVLKVHDIDVSLVGRSCSAADLWFRNEAILA